jgi:hypothetical protein
MVKLIAMYKTPAGMDIMSFAKDYVIMLFGEVRK